MKTFSQKDKSKILKSLRIYIDCNFSIEIALKKIARSFEHKKEVYACLLQASGEISKGKLISATFYELGLCTVSESELIKSGELSGNLSRVITAIEGTLALRKEITQAITQAFLYPIIIGILTLLLLSFLLLYIFPQVMPIFASFHQKLPLITRFMILLVTNIKKFWMWVCIAALLIIVVCVIFKNKTVILFHKIKELLLRKTPYIKSVFLKIELASWSHHVSMMLQSSISPETVFAYASVITKHPLLIQTSKNILVQIKQGKPIEDGFTNDSLEMKELKDLVGYGDETGRLAETFSLASCELKKDALDSLKKVTSLLEPLLLVVMGIMIGAVAYSMIAPIYGLTADINK